MHPNLKGRAFAIQQHQDIIAVSPDFPSCVAAKLLLVAFALMILAEPPQVNYAARAAGVKKHMAPKEVCVPDKPEFL